MQQPSYFIVLIAALFLFSIFRRVRRNIGWQPFIQRRLVSRTIVFAVIGFLFLSGSFAHPISLISDAGGIVIGVVLAYYGAKMTNFEERNSGLYYRPNTWIGSLVTAIFFARLIYRLYQVYSMKDTISQMQQTSNSNGFASIGTTMGNSWSAGLILIMFAYYVVYYLFIIQKQKQLAGQGKNL